MAKSKAEKHRLKRAAKQRRARLNRRGEDKIGTSSEPSDRRNSVPPEFFHLFESLLHPEGESLPSNIRRDLERFYGSSGDMLLKVVLDLDGFLYNEKPWKLTLSDLDSVHSTFTRFEREELFETIAALLISNEPSDRWYTDGPDEGSLQSSWPFSSQRLSSEKPWSVVSSPLGRLPFMMLALLRVTREGRKRGPLVSPFMKVLREIDFGSKCSGEFLAVCALLLKAKKFPCPELLTKLERFLLGHHSCLAEDEGYEAMLSFLKEFLLTVSESFYPDQWKEYPCIVKYVFGIDPLRILAAQENGLKNVNLDGNSQWGKLLATDVHAERLSFEDTVKYRFAILRILTKRSRFSKDPELTDQLTGHMASLVKWLSHGVPHHARNFAKTILPKVVDFYLSGIRWDNAARSHKPLVAMFRNIAPHDYRVAALCHSLYSKKEQKQERPENQAVPWERVSYEPLLFALFEASEEHRSSCGEILYNRLDNETRRNLLLCSVQHEIYSSCALEEARWRWKVLWNVLAKDDPYVNQVVLQSDVVEPEILFLFLVEEMKEASVASIGVVMRWLRRSKQTTPLFVEKRKSFLSYHLPSLFMQKNIQRGGLALFREQVDVALFSELELAIRKGLNLLKQSTRNLDERRTLEREEFYTWFGNQKISRSLKKLLSEKKDSFSNQGELFVSNLE